MRGDQRVATQRCEPRSDQRCGCCDEAVEDDRDAVGGGAEYQADEEGDLEAAKHGQNGQRVLRIRLVDLECLPDRREFAREAGIVDASAAAADEFSLDVE